MLFAERVCKVDRISEAEKDISNLWISGLVQVVYEIQPLSRKQSSLMLDRMPLYVVSFSHVEPRPRRLIRLMVKVFFPGLFSLLIGGFLTSCSTISGYDQTAYEHVTDIKVDTLVVMGKATDSYASHQREIGELQIALDKAYEYDRNRPLNEITVKMWDKLLDPQGALLGGFLLEWKEDGRLLPKYVRHKKEQIGEAFDTIIQLESGKLRASQAQNKL
jgi:hypothetical protein